MYCMCICSVKTSDIRSIYLSHVSEMYAVHVCNVSVCYVIK